MIAQRQRNVAGASMSSPNTMIRDSDWLQQHIQSNERTGDVQRKMQSTKDLPSVRRESPGRSKNTPIIVPGEEAPPLIIVESRDISPAKSYEVLSSPRSESDDHHLNHKRDKNDRNSYRGRSRTLSPSPRSRNYLSFLTSKSDEDTGSDFDGGTPKHGASYFEKTKSKESAVHSDAITTPHENRKSSNDYADRQDGAVPNIASMTSSLTSADSQGDRLGELQYLPSTLRPTNSLTKQRHSQSQKIKQFIQQYGEQKGHYNQHTTEVGTEKKASMTSNNSMNQRSKKNMKSDVRVVGDYPSSPPKTSEITPDIIYDALDNGGAERDKVDNDEPDLRYDLSGVLRGSSSDASSFFHDFRNPNITPSSKKSSRSITKKEAIDKFVVSPISKSPDQRYSERSKEVRESRQTKARQHAPIRSLVDNDHDDVMSSYSNVDDIPNHSILQLCTEDLMSDDATRVNAALERLLTVCCVAGNTKAMKATRKTSSSVVSTASNSSSVLNRVRFIKAGGHALIVGVMKKFTSDFTIQATACKLVRQLILMDEYNVPQSSSNSTSGQIPPTRNGNAGAFNELFSAVYGMDCVISALRRFRPRTSDGGDLNEVYNLASGALVAIICSSFKMVDRLLQHDARNISIFLKAIHAPINKNSPGATRVIYYVLKQFPQYINEIVIAGGIEEIFNEMKYFPEIMEVQYCGCAAIGTLLRKNSRMILSSLSPQDEARYDDQSLVDYIVNHLDGPNIIVAALKAFPHNEDIQGKGVIALCNLTTSAAATKAGMTVASSIKKAGGLSAIGIALENFPNNQTVQDNGCLAIKSLLESANVIPSTK